MIHPYEYICAYSTPMSTFKRLSLLDLEIYKVGYQDHLTIDGDTVSYQKNN
jgi:hypothetical protein